MKSFFRVWLGIGLVAMGLGIGLMILAIGTNRFHRAEATSSLNESYEGVNSIDLQINYKEVNIVEGEQFAITADNLMEDEIVSKVIDGTWYIKQNTDNFINIFGLSISTNQIYNWGDYHSPSITITIPKGFVAQNMKLKIAAGTLEAKSLQVENCDFNVEAGTLKVSDLKVSGESRFQVGAGEMILENLQAKDTHVECGVGRINIGGNITGNSSIKNGVGEVDLSLQGKEEDYSYEVNCDIGEVRIGDETYHNISNKIVNRKNVNNSLNLDCSVGNLTVEFN